MKEEKEQENWNPQNVKPETLRLDKFDLQARFKKGEKKTKPLESFQRNNFL